MYSKEELGVTQIENIRQRVLNLYKSPEDVDLYKKNFIESFSALLLNEKRDKLKDFILLLDGSHDLESLESILVQYQDAYNHSVHNVKDYCFGTQIMRMFYLLNLPDDAVKVNRNQTKNYKFLILTYAFVFNE